MRLLIVTLSLAFLVNACGSPTERVTECVSDRDCASGVCAASLSASPVDLDPLALTCAVLADAGLDTPCCQRSEDCARGICLLSGSCAVPCADAEDCLASERCAPVHARAGELAVQTLNACVSRAELPVDVRVTETLFPGVLTTDPAGVAIDLPAIEGTAVFVLQHPVESLWPLTVECRTPLCIRALQTRDASPTLLFDATTLQAGNTAPINTVNGGIDNLVSTIMLPNGPRSVLSASGYQATVRSESAGDLALTVLERSSRGSVLDLHLHYVGANGLKPEGARGPMFVASALERAESILDQAGLVLGQVCQTEVVGALADRLSIVDPPRFGLLLELPELFALSAGARGSAIHVFLVDQADVALGISGGLPGPPGMHGTGSSGVVMSVALFDTPEQLGRALAHELGHYLGLFHPVEADNVTLDPLPDSPRDPSNLMFRSATGGEALTANQASVIGASPVLR